MSDKKRITFISIAQIIAMLFIVLSHSFPDRQSVPTAALALIPFLQQGGLTLFMWASGYLLIKTDSIHKHGYLKYLKRRFARLMLPFFVIQIIMLIPKYLMSTFAHEEVSLSPLAILKSFLYPRQGILPHLWFLPTLMFLSLMAPVLMWIAKNIYGRIALLLVSGVFVLLPGVTNLLCINDIKNYLFWFVLGMITANSFSEACFKRPIPLICTISGGGLYLLIAICTTSNNYIQLVLNILSLVCITALSLLMDKHLDKLCNAVSKYTFPIYILSLPIQNIVEIILVKLNCPWYITLIGMFVFGIVVPFIVSVMVIALEKNAKHKVLSRCIGL